ncbi:MAG: chemotaxis protein [Verrucomicrobiaceae bacterium]|nr:chemotaxis protein [Verrucomicrobiaceae bacterium]
MSTVSDEGSESNKDLPRPYFPVVGIGASAGGLATIQCFFENMPTDSGMAFVVILHLSPDHESNADAILQRSTPIPVIQVTERVPLQPNHIYVIPPAHTLIMEDGHLALSAREKSRLPIAIDLFFRTLAEAHRERAICIVLSGFGSDGAVGLTQVKEHGGVTIAQLPEDADYDGMPRAAISTTHVDIILPVAEIPQRLLDLWKNAKEIRLPTSGDDEQVLALETNAEQNDEAALNAILKTLRERTNHDFRFYKRATMLRRLERRLQVNALPNLSAYRDYLNQNPGETSFLLQDMLISVTNFFRDRDAFEVLEHQVIPSLFSNRDDPDPIRAWVAGCATGEEAYSISILLREYMDVHSAATRAQIFATDIDERAIAMARAGVYPSAIATDVSQTRLQNYFVADHDNFCVAKSAREPVLFAAHNVLRDPPFSRLDLICCRNLLIYLDRDAQKNVLETFHFALKPDGYLFLGNSETEDAAPNLFTVVDKKNRIYRANPRANSVRYLPTLPSSAFDDRNRLPLASPRERRRQSFTQIHQRGLEKISPPTVLLDRDYNILHLSVDVGRYLQHQSGDASHNLLANIRPELRLELRTALFKAVQSESNVDTQPIRIQIDGAPISLRIAVRHYRDHELAQELLIVVFESIENISINAEPMSDPNAELLVRQLESQIARYKSDLQETIERSEVSTEELKASNEELQAINEELRSATEELETSKEELQSMNEELITLNYELKLKIEETDASNDYLYNLIASTDIATIFIDKDLHIVRFTPRATDIFKLIFSDHGRALTDIRHQLDYDELIDDANDAFRTLRGSQRKVRGADGKYYLARVLPYRTKEDKIEGAVLTFIDVTALHKAEEQVRVGEERLKLAAETTKDYAIITSDEAGVITTWNAGAVTAFGYTEAEAIGKQLEFIYTAEDRSSGKYKSELQRARDFNKSDDERWYMHKNGSTFFGSGVLSVIGGDTAQGYVKIIRDISSNKRLETEREAQLIREKSARQKIQLASEMKDEFLAVLSHELKHPLNLIHVNAELLAHLPEARELPAVVRATDTIRRTVLSQAKIIDDLLDLSRARTGKLTLTLTPNRLNEPIATMVEAAAADAANKSITVDYFSDDEALVSICDPVRVEQILWNLLSNAIKFTPPRGLIQVRLVRDEKFAKLSVADNGEGISEDYLTSVFEMFNQGSRVRARRDGGMGIGLALVKEFVSAQQGHVKAESAGLGKGSTFTVWLPLCETTHAIEHSKKSSADLLKGLRILVVDDSADSLATFAMLLQMLGATVQTATSGVLALEYLDSNTCDLLISDIGMPEMTGNELIVEVRKRENLATLPAIALTGYGRPEDKERALEHGFNAHLPKPTSLEDLQRVITDLQKQRRLAL